MILISYNIDVVYSQENCLAYACISCDCGQRQTMNHIVDTCPLTKFEGWLNLLHEADDNAVICLESTAIAALAK